MDHQPFFHSGYVYAVIGATENTAKYGYKVFRDLKSAGWTVIPVNPKAPVIDTVQAVPTISAAQPRPEVAVFVVPPEIGLKILDEVVAAGITKVWFQPGAESKKIQERTQELGLNAVTDGSCVMVERHNYS